MVNPELCDAGIRGRVGNLIPGQEAINRRRDAAVRVGTGPVDGDEDADERSQHCDTRDE